METNENTHKPYFLHMAYLKLDENYKLFSNLDHGKHILSN